MKILAISGILPVPGHILQNNFLLKILKELNNYDPNSEIRMVRSIGYYSRIASLLRPNMKKRFIVRKLKNYILDGYKVDVFTYPSYYRFKNINALASFFLGWLMNYSKIKRLMTGFHPDIVTAQNFFPDGCIAYYIKKKYGIPYTITTHNELHYLKGRISRIIALKILRSASKVTPINYRNYNTFKNFGLNNLQLIPLGFESKFLAYHKLHKETQVIKIITIAELIELKNIDKVIIALSILMGEGVKFEYNVFGEGPQKEKLIELANNSGLKKQVIFHGYINNELLPDIIEKHDIFILPSYYETFGRVFFEAMAIGLPIICAKNSGIHQYFKEMHEGISVNHSNINEIVDNLKLLIKDLELRIKIGENGKKLVEKYTWEEIGKMHYNLYSEIINN